MQSFIINLAIAAFWLLFSQSQSLTTFGIGFGLGFFLLWLFQGVLGSEDYTRRALGFIRFVLVFLKEFVLANIAVVGIILFKSRESIQPNFLTLDVTGMKPYEILILTYCITLTPGTTSVLVEDDFKTMIVHALDARKPGQVREQINLTLKNAILSFTR